MGTVLERAVPLQEWADTHETADQHTWRTGYWPQILFVRDRLQRLFVSPREVRDVQTVRVVGTHTSKSVLLPVYRISVEGLEVQLRYNFYDWKVSVSSDRPVPDVFLGLFDPADRIHPAYCEGFATDWVFSAYTEDKQRFTLQLGDEYEVYTFLFLLTSLLGVRERQA